jgi:tetratricopeptide (TPR) repeat protein
VVEFEEYEEGGLDELEELAGDDGGGYEEDVDDESIGPSEDESDLGSDYEALPKVGAMSGMLVNLLILVIAVVMIVIFVTNNLWDDVDNLYSLTMGMELVIGLAGVAGLVLLYVSVSSNIAMGDYLCRKDTKEAYKAAVEKYSKALSIDKRSKKAWTSKGLALRMMSHNKSNLMEALKCQNMALKLDPKFGVAWVNKGNVLFNLGQPNQALKCYDKAIDLDPDYTVAWVNKGEMLVKMGRRAEAQRCLDKARTLAA